MFGDLVLLFTVYSADNNVNRDVQILPLREHALDEIFFALYERQEFLVPEALFN